MLCACKNRPWSYTDSIWYSEEPSVQIYYEDKMWYIDVTKDGITEKYLFVWTYTFSVGISPLNADVYSDENRLFWGKIDKFNSNKFVVMVHEDKIWNYENIVITLYRKPAN